MPKEITHLTISERAFQALERNSPETGKVLRKHYALYMLGSIIPDTAYYHIPLLGEKESIAFLSARIHTPLGCLEERFLERTLKDGFQGDEEAFAFCCGILSHHIADASFHPFIFYHTGSLEESDSLIKRRAEARHRFLEGLIDLKVMSTSPGDVNISPCNAAPIFKSTEGIVPSLSSFVKAILPEADEQRLAFLTKKLDRTRRFQLRLLCLYSKGPFKALILLLNRWRAYRHENLAGLLYADKSYLNLDILNKEVNITDPVTGAVEKLSLSGLLEGSVARLADSIGLLGKSFSADLSNPLLTDIIRPCSHGDARSLEQKEYDTREVDGALDRFMGVKAV